MTHMAQTLPHMPHMTHMPQMAHDTHGTRGIGITTHGTLPTATSSSLWTPIDVGEPG